MIDRAPTKEEKQAALAKADEATVNRKQLHGHLHPRKGPRPIEILAEVVRSQDDDIKKLRALVDAYESGKSDREIAIEKKLANSKARAKQLKRAIESKNAAIKVALNEDLDSDHVWIGLQKALDYDGIAKETQPT